MVEGGATSSHHSGSKWGHFRLAHSDGSWPARTPVSCPGPDRANGTAPGWCHSPGRFARSASTATSSPPSVAPARPAAPVPPVGLQLHRLDRRVLDPEQPPPYPRCAHAVPVLNVSDCGRPETLDRARRAPPLDHGQAPTGTSVAPKRRRARQGARDCGGVSPDGCRSPCRARARPPWRNHTAQKHQERRAPARSPSIGSDACSLTAPMSEFASCTTVARARSSLLPGRLSRRRSGQRPDLSG